MKLQRKKIIFALALSFVLVFINVVTAFPAQAALDTWQKGVSIRSKWNEDFGSGSFRQTVDNAANAKINSISLIIPYYQSNLYSTDIQRGGDTPTDAALISAINYIHSKGIQVMLKPHLESWGGEWRAYINPSDRNGWFTNYGNILNRLGEIAKNNGVEEICIGTELVNMAASTSNGSNTQNWKNLIANLRNVYSGRLTYSANWGPKDSFGDEKNHIDFWDSLDYIGVSAYYNLNTDNSVQSLKNAWDGYRISDLQPLAERWNKGIVFTELGYKSVNGAHYEPWNSGRSGGADLTEQANDYTALFDYWKDQPFMQGIQLWEWDSNPNAGGPADNGYTPQRKTAQDVMVTWFGGSGNSTPTPPLGLASFNASAPSNPTTINANQDVNFTATVGNTSSNGAADSIVDIEIYNAGGQKVFQKFFEHEFLGPNQTKTYNFNWSTAQPGNYRLKIGIFNNNWSQNLYWQDNALDISVGGGSIQPPPNDNPPPQNNPPPTSSSIVYINGYPTVNGNYIDCNGNIDNDPAHHTTDGNDTDPAHHIGQNCPAGSYVTTH